MVHTCMYGTQFGFLVDRHVSFGLEQHGAFWATISGSGVGHSRYREQGEIMRPWLALIGVPSRNYSS